MTAVPRFKVRDSGLWDEDVTCDGNDIHSFFCRPERSR